MSFRSNKSLVLLASCLVFLVEAELARSEAAGERAIPLNVPAERRAAALRARGAAKLKSVDLSVATKEVKVVKSQAEALRLSRDALLAIANVEPAQQRETKGAAGDHPINSVQLLAPADGVVVKRDVNPGQWTTAGEKLLAIAEYSVVQIEDEIPESLLPRITGRSSDTVRIRTAADHVGTRGIVKPSGLSGTA